MKIDHNNNTVLFDNLVSVKREMGSNEGITTTLPRPAEKAVAVNARGEFADTDLESINSQAIENAKRLVAAQTH